MIFAHLDSTHLDSTDVWSFFVSHFQTPLTLMVRLIFFIAISKVHMFLKQPSFPRRNNKIGVSASGEILRTPYSVPLNVVGLSFMILAAPSLLPQSGQADSGTEMILPLDEESFCGQIDSTCGSFFFSKKTWERCFEVTLTGEDGNLEKLFA